MICKILFCFIIAILIYISLAVFSVYTHSLLVMRLLSTSFLPVLCRRFWPTAAYNVSIIIIIFCMYRSGYTWADGGLDGHAHLLTRGDEERAAATCRRLQTSVAQTRGIGKIALFKY